MKPAVVSRVMQFCAGPQQEQFFACDEHAADLERGNVTCFLRLKAEPVRPVDRADDIPCDLCREGGGEPCQA